MLLEIEKTPKLQNHERALAIARKMIANKKLMQEEALKDAKTESFKHAVEILKKKNEERGLTTRV